VLRDVSFKRYINNYWCESANGYNRSVQQVIHSQDAKNAWKDLFTEMLGKKSISILDVGTGPGIIALLLAEQGHNVTGVDQSEEMLANARRNAQACNLAVRFKQGDAEKLPFQDGSFDAVVNRHVLWTVTDPEKAIFEWWRILKPGGRIVVIDGNWYHNDKSLKKAAWRCASKVLILVTEHRDPRVDDFDEGVKEKLWSVKANRPNLDVEFLEKAGFEDIRVMNNIRSRTQSRLEYLKSGYWGDIFLVTGIKR
jgi:ubiquinone/menaquinone biosynthesis C-methylase UbiE